MLCSGLSSFFEEAKHRVLSLMDSRLFSSSTGSKKLAAGEPSGGPVTQEYQQQANFDEPLLTERSIER